MKRKSLILLAGLLLAFSAGLKAQDLIGSTNSATRSYNYVEIQYFPDMEIDLPFLATAIVEVKDHWSLWGEYLKQDFDNIGSAVGLGEDVSVDASASLLSLGVLYHDQFTHMTDTDWVAGLLVGSLDIEIELNDTGQRASETSTVYDVYLGLRRTLGPKLEGELGVNAFINDGDQTYTGDIKFVYRVKPAIDVAIAMSEIGEGENLGIGLRYTWQ